jgi:hypothetical protein
MMGAMPLIPQRSCAAKAKSRLMIDAVIVA